MFVWMNARTEENVASENLFTEDNLAIYILPNWVYLKGDLPIYKAFNKK